MAPEESLIAVSNPRDAWRLVLACPRGVVIGTGLVAYAALYSAAYWSSVRFGVVASGAGAAATWVPSGLQVSALLLCRDRRLAASILAAGLLSELLTGWWLFGGVHTSSVVVALGNAGEAVLATWLVRVWTRRLTPDLRRATDVVALGMAAIIAPALNAAVTLPSFDYRTWATKWLYFKVYWLGDATAIVALVPVALTLFALLKHEWRNIPARSLELGMLLVVATLITLFVFGRTNVPPTETSAITMLWPVLAWAAFRTGPAGTALLNLAVIVSADALTRSGRGPFGSVPDTGGARVAALQAVLIMMALSSVALAAVLSERQVAENALAHAGETDGITGLPTLEVARRTVERLRKADGVTAVLAIDLDDFDDVNSAHGRAVGDEVLRQVGARLAGGLRTDDMVARGTGDSFVVVFARLPNAESAEVNAERTIGALAAPIVASGCVVATSACSGLAIVEGRDSADDVLTRAKTALSQSQLRGRGRHSSLDTATYRQLDDERRLQSELRTALSASELAVHYQPIVSLADRRVIGVEALLRWHHSRRGLLSAGAFLPGAEASGLVLALDDWVIARALSDVTMLRSRGGLQDVMLFVNVSARTLAEAGCADRICAQLTAADVSPSSVIIELTETALMDNGENARDAAAALASIGTGLALDDFGQGHSSLARLRALPIRIVKIDQTFVAGMGTHAVDDAVVRWTAQLATELGLSTVAEGVESTSQLEMLEASGVDLVQGYFIARPMAVTDLAARIGPDGRLRDGAAVETEIRV